MDKKLRRSLWWSSSSTPSALSSSPSQPRSFGTLEYEQPSFSFNGAWLSSEVTLKRLVMAEAIPPKEKPPKALFLQLWRDLLVWDEQINVLKHLHLFRYEINRHQVQRAHLLRCTREVSQPVA